MSADDASRWKEKYLKSIEQQDKLERRWNARLDLLRRGLVRRFEIVGQSNALALGLCFAQGAQLFAALGDELVGVSKWASRRKRCVGQGGHKERVTGGRVRCARA